MSRKVTLNVYSIEELKELSPKGFEHAFNKWCESDCPWSSDMLDILDKLQEIFPIQVTAWCVESEAIRFNMTCDEDIEELSGVRLQKYIWNNYFNDLFKGKYFSTYKSTGLNFKSRHSKIIFNTDCVLTGTCYDNDVLKPIYDFLEDGKQALFGHRVIFTHLMEQMLDAWIFTFSKVLSDYYTEEVFIEDSNTNEWEYFIDGSIL